MAEMFLCFSWDWFCTHFQKSILTQKGFSLNLMAFCSLTSKSQIFKSMPQILLLVCLLGKGLTTPETQTQPNPDIATALLTNFLHQQIVVMHSHMFLDCR